MRKVTIERYPLTSAPGSVLIHAGQTRVLCTASPSGDVPAWLAREKEPRGWVTADYNMLPGSTQPRHPRKTDGRATEIKRLISRALRAAVNLEAMAGLLIHCDCEVLSADGGTRTASITGACIALYDALEFAVQQNMIRSNPFIGPIAAISVGIIDQQAHLDLDYALDSRAELDLNIAMNDRGEYIEIQGTGERSTFSRSQLDELLDLASGGIDELLTIQKTLLASRPIPLN